MQDVYKVLHNGCVKTKHRDTAVNSAYTLTECPLQHPGDALHLLPKIKYAK
jgi:hypothetical protein